MIVDGYLRLLAMFRHATGLWGWIMLGLTPKEVDEEIGWGVLRARYNEEIERTRINPNPWTWSFLTDFADRLYSHFVERLRRRKGAQHEIRNFGDTRKRSLIY